MSRRKQRPDVGRKVTNLLACHKFRINATGEPLHAVAVRAGTGSANNRKRHCERRAAIALDRMWRA